MVNFEMKKYNVATSCKGDLALLHCGIIVPEFITTCRPMKSFTALDILIPVFQYIPEVFFIVDLLHIHLSKGRVHPIPISLSFGMHYFLTSVIELK